MNCPTCDATTPDGLPCDTCTRRLRRNLRDLPWLLGQINHTITRQNRTTEPIRRSPTSEQPLPYNPDAADTRDLIIRELADLTRLLDYGDLRPRRDAWTVNPAGQISRGVSYGPTPRNPTDWAHWLTRQEQRIRSRHDFRDITATITHITNTLRAALKPVQTIYIGDCDLCGTPLRAPEDADRIECRGCREQGNYTTYPVRQSQRQLRKQAEQALLTRAECFDAAPIYGIHLKPATWRSWTHRGQLQPRHIDHHGRPLYRLGDALTLARRARRRRTA